MVMPANNSNARPVWFVGASFGGVNDQTERFISEGVWEGGPEDQYGDAISSIQAGDRIAIKSWYTRKNGLKFDNRGEYVSIIAIKAIGTVIENMGDRRSLKVDWTPVASPREWYFHTFNGTVWQVVPDTWWRQALVRFAFDGEDQDINQTLRIPYWGEKYGYLDDQDEHQDTEELELLPPEPSQPYTIANILADGCFLPQPTLETILRRLQTKQNIILQGPPGTGKTWLAKRLAYALIGQKDDSKVCPFQFHPNMSYEDFVRGWRPSGDGRLELVDGPFLQLADEAREDPDGKYVMVIEEINRGNPAAIFGELLTLLESDKRSRNDALALAYPRDDGERFHIPPNVYVIGTMNTADRSIAMIDLALRRRFAFFDLEPQLNDDWRDWVHEQSGIPTDFLDDIAQRITAFNDQIAADPNLGRQFRIGHSHVTPPPATAIDNPAEWFTEIVETEIAPLLREYWFDDGERADEEAGKLLSGLP